MSAVERPSRGCDPLRGLYLALSVGAGLLVLLAPSLVTPVTVAFGMYGVLKLR
jgi:hypothetical protein